MFLGQHLVGLWSAIMASRRMRPTQILLMPLVEGLVGIKNLMQSFSSRRSSG